MKTCFCRLILALLVIVFAWWNVSWAAIALTVIGAILAIMANVTAIRRLNFSRKVLMERNGQ